MALETEAKATVEQVVDAAVPELLKGLMAAAMRTAQPGVAAMEMALALTGMVIAISAKPAQDQRAATARLFSERLPGVVELAVLAVTPVAGSA